MRPCLLIFFLITSQLVNSQFTYQSLFSSTTNKWNILYTGIDYANTDTVFITADTVVSGVTWKKLYAISTPFSYNPKGIVREDTIAGKVWYQGLNGDTAKLLYDFSLVKGDTFNINSAWKTYTTIEKTVDTTYIRDGRKHIVFKGTIYSGNGYPNTPVTFIEGVGSNTGLLYKSAGNPLFSVQYLLCAFKNGVQTFTNTAFGGQCYIRSTAVSNLIRTSEIRIFPTAFSSQVRIENKSNYKFTQITIINTVGQVVYSSTYQNYLNLSDLPAGIYYLNLITEKKQVFRKTILRK